MKTELFEASFTNSRIAVVIPSYKVTRHISDVISAIPPMVWRIYVIDDACPEGSGQFVETNVFDNRVRVLYHQQNQGVGGAVMTGYQAAIADGAGVIVKIDGDGQMDANLIPYFVEPILAGEVDYTKGNRFYNLEEVRAMPHVRLFGNAVLSLMTKLSSGYWNLFDPTNGYTAIHTDVAIHLPFGKISRRYFFETDMLFRLNTLRAVVVDVPMDAKYGDEISNLKISKIIGEFVFKHARNFFKRIFYNYYLRDLSLASIELPLGLLMLISGIGFGVYHWLASARSGFSTPPGTVMLAAMPILVGLQFVLAFIGYDISSVPKRSRHRKRFSLLSDELRKSNEKPI
ncbi:glycosyltransferase family 2 protein [Desulfopila sp. IMCC35006]|uniref:glycosyltransferase family 2 protein n=1 Tax=Desulfopila sp. IMCC35006 TaxID=2569542 RepID=UPI0010ACCEA9|nr:glycosyltransferase family 2 protein [Desulfopila sp. IMCC35006]TKB26116.1 glycosyltransferase family 2 protein [Desulfopila sp. IMCC35006]